MLTSESNLPRYRWVIEGLVLAMLIVQVATWLAPAPILGPMIKSLRISLSEAGLVISVIALCIAVFSFLGAIIIEYLGTLRALLVGLWLMGLAEVASGYSPNFAALILFRIIEGIGYGIIIGPPAALVMQWFGEREWPYINMVNAVCAYVGIALVFAITPLVYYAMGEHWQRVVGFYGWLTIIVAILWTLLGRERQTGIAATGHISRASNVREVARMRGVVLMSIALFGGMWVFQLFTAFLPEFFQVERGLKLAEAASLTALLPLTGVFAAAAGGIATGIIGLRKPFLWPMAILTLAGCAGAVLIPSVNGIRLSLVLVGIGAAAGLAATGTLMMELPGMTPAKMGTAFAIIWAVGYAGAFVSPFLGGALVPSFGLRSVLLAFAAFEILPIVALFLLPETGPGRKTMAVVSPTAVRG